MSNVIIRHLHRDDRPKHRASDKCKTLVAEVKRLAERLQHANALIRQLINDTSDANRARRTAETKLSFAEDTITIRDGQIRDLTARIRDLEEARGKAPEAEAPTATRFECGSVVRLGARTPDWSPLTDGETTQPIPLGQLPQTAAAA
ncbi:hypothetical protein [Streptomyces sp. OR43]|uniref:hypothetical protein n=1 Tax=Streptomyces sp. or43 TaxID=2478957 RepID=UPI0011CD8927|nr:hypothetical protein [Streptomyces sp. or43]TXS48903.1 hypothetical protein EAO72_02815 [Streptomyces sp. or43]